ncbi:hypothetical protein LMK04_12240 (plasmid) [Lactococcus petauri]|jgi:energy-coupling factor transporter transmembrane protein EcfT|nr:hypothetical protein LMK04_12240 [Lactococcus petauri]
MINTITNELVKINFNQTNLFILSFFIFLAIVFLIVLLGFLQTLYMQDYYNIMGIGMFLVLLGISLVFLGFNIFMPLSLTKKTEIRMENLNVIRVEDKLSNSDQLKLLVRSKDGKISTKKVNINDKNTTVKISSENESYTEKVTQITYNTKQKLNAEFKNTPKNEMKKEVTVYLQENQIE